MVRMAAGAFLLQDGPTTKIVGTIFVFLPCFYHRIAPGRRCAFSARGGGANRRRNAMRLLMVAMAAALLAVPAPPAYSQVSKMGPSSMSQQSQKPPEEKKNEKTPAQKKAEEKAYNDAINRIPDAKFDPWRTVR
jgi:hypothetical protein